MYKKIKLKPDRRSVALTRHGLMLIGKDEAIVDAVIVRGVSPADTVPRRLQIGCRFAALKGRGNLQRFLADHFEPMPEVSASFEAALYE